MPEPVPGRSCDGCYMCCKTPEIAVLEKPHGVWCKNCLVGSGCQIYDSRPDVCRQFLCAYRMDKSLGEEWKPSVAKFILYIDGRAKRITAYVDSDRKDAWRKEPYYSQLKRWSVAAAQINQQVVVAHGTRVIVLLPTGEADLGEVTADDRVVTQWIGTGAERRYEAFKWRKDDPRLALLK